MKIKSYLKLAMVGAATLMFMTSDAFAQARVAVPVDFEAGEEELIEVYANIDNTITAAVTDLNFGNMGAISSLTPGDQAILIMAANTTGVFDTTNAIDGAARLIPAGANATAAAGTPGVITIAAGDAFGSTAIYTTYSNLTNLTCATCTVGTPVIELRRVNDNRGTLLGTACPTATAVNGVVDLDTPANNAVGCSTTAATGALQFFIGATIQTVNGAPANQVYETGEYVGSFDMVMEY